MAVDAHPRAHHRVFQLAKARAQIGEMLLAHLGIGVGGGADPGIMAGDPAAGRSEEHTSELQSLMRISYAVFCLKKKTQKNKYRLCNASIYTQTKKQTRTTDYKMTKGNYNR